MGFTLTNTKGNHSATKWGTLLIGASFLVTTLTKWGFGDLSNLDAVTQIITEVGGVFTVWGVRDLPFFN